MTEIKVESGPTDEKLKKLKVKKWGIWEKEVSKFDWEYTDNEMCYILEGEVTVTPEGGKGVKIVAGDFVTFPKGMKCVWDVTKDIKKHYKFY